MKKILFSHLSDEWITPQNFFNVLNKTFHFDLDPCAYESDFEE